MAVATIMAAASAHHPSLRPRRLSSSASVSWVVAGGAGTAAGPAGRSASTVGQRQYQQIPVSRFNAPPPPHQIDTHSMHSSRGRPASRAGSLSSSSRSPSSRSSQLSDSPRVRLNMHSHLDHIAASGEEGQLLSVGGHGTGSRTMTTVGGQRMRRPRRRADEVERLYKCIWNGCEKSYGTLSHLNDHVRLQRHGTKREPYGELSCFQNYPGLAPAPAGWTDPGGYLYMFADRRPIALRIQGSQANLETRAEI
jgi:hypothetical protein